VRARDIRHAATCLAHDNDHPSSNSGSRGHNLVQWAWNWKSAMGPEGAAEERSARAHVSPTLGHDLECLAFQGLQKY